MSFPATIAVGRAARDNISVAPRTPSATENLDAKDTSAF
jgi:hypothetical protein